MGVETSMDNTSEVSHLYIYNYIDLHPDVKGFGGEKRGENPFAESCRHPWGIRAAAGANGSVADVKKALS